MKKKSIAIVLAVFASLIAIMISCGKFNFVEVHVRSMVNAYYTPKELQIYKTNKRGIFSLKMITTGGKYGYYNSEGDAKYFYDTWCRKHGDMTYDRKVEFGNSSTGYILPHAFVAADYTSVNITCDVDWDDRHPAGTSLNDIVMFYSTSPIKYIESGYTELYDWGEVDAPDIFYKSMYNHGYIYKRSIAEGISPFHPVIKPVNELTQEDMVLLGSGDVESNNVFAILEFTSMPDSYAERTITVTVTTDKEETFSASIELAL